MKQTSDTTGCFCLLTSALLQMFLRSIAVSWDLFVEFQGLAWYQLIPFE